MSGFKVRPDRLRSSCRWHFLTIFQLDSRGFDARQSLT
jgi:hypothetical protein